MGYELVATRGAERCINGLGIRCAAVNRVMEGSPHVFDLMREGRLAMEINTPEAGTKKDSFHPAHGAETAPAILHHDTGAQAAVTTIAALREDRTNVAALQDYHRGERRRVGAVREPPLLFKE